MPRDLTPQEYLQMFPELAQLVGQSATARVPQPAPLTPKRAPSQDIQAVAPVTKQSEVSAAAASTPEVPMSFEDQIRASYGAHLEKVKAGTQSLENQLQQYLTKQQEVDLSPLLALTDSWSGSQFARSYTKPETLEERAKVAAGLQDLINKQNTGMAKDELDFLKASLAAKDDSRTKGTQRRYESTQIRLAEKELGTWKDSKLMKPLGEAMRTILPAEEAVRSGNLGRIKSVLGGLARFVGRDAGALSDSDLSRQMMETIATDVAKAQAWITDNPNKPIPEELTRPLMENIADAKRVFKDVIEMTIEQKQLDLEAGEFTNPYMAPGRGLNKIMENTRKGASDILNKSFSAKSGSGLSPEKQKRLEELRAKKEAGAF